MCLRLKLDYGYLAPAAVTIDTNPFTLIVNPLLLGKYTIKEMVYIICHEIEHLVLDHPAEGLKVNQIGDPEAHELLNLAMDASVNDRLDMEIDKYKLNIMSKPDGRITSKYLMIILFIIYLIRILISRRNVH